MNIAILVLDGGLGSAVSILLDVLRTSAAHLGHPSGTNLSVRSVAGEPVRLASGLRLQPETALDHGPVDIAVVPGLEANSCEHLDALLGRADVRAALPWLRSVHAEGGHVYAGCTSTFVLAEAGLLDGRSATTTWWLSEHFRRRYPAVRLVPASMVVREDRIVTSGAAMSHMELALTIVDQLHGPAHTDAVARRLLLDHRTSQARFMTQDHVSRIHPDLLRADGWIRAHLSSNFTIDDIARAVGLSARTLSRRIKDATGDSPIRFVQRVRVEQALHELQTTADPVDEIAERVGYASGRALRRVMQKQTGWSPSAYRSRSHGPQIQHTASSMPSSASSSQTNS